MKDRAVVIPQLVTVVVIRLCPARTYIEGILPFLNKLLEKCLVAICLDELIN